MGGTSTEALEALLRRSEGVALRFDLERRALTLVTDGIEGLTGYGPARWKTDPPLEVLTPEAREVLSDLADRARRAAIPTEVTYDIVDRHGKPRRILQRHVVIRDAAGGAVALEGVLLEISTRTNASLRWREGADEALLGAAARYRTIAEHFPRGVVALYDRELRYVAIHGEGLRAVGLSPADLVGRRLRDVFDEEVWERDEPALRAALDGEPTESVVAFGERWFRVLTVPVKDASGAIRHGMVISQDITELKQTELALRRALERLTMAARIARLGVWSVDLRTGQLEWSDEIYALMGKSPDEPEPRFDEWIERVHPDDLPEAMRRVERAREGLELDVPLVVRVRRPDGGIGHVSTLAYAERDDDGAVARLVGVTRDITDEVHRERVEQRSRQAQKLEAVGQLTGGVAHDFNNLLQVILGQTEEAQELIDVDHQAQAALTDVMAAAQRARRLVSQLLAFGRQQLIRPQTFDLHEVLDSLLEMLGPLFGPQVVLRWTPADTPVHVRADLGSLEQVVMNLCLNARDATFAAGGTVEVRAAHVTLDTDAADELGVRPGEYARIDVADDGVGMSERVLARAFDPFFSTKERDKGTGLGLATGYGIVKQHEGTVVAESAPGQGATFTVYWPAADAAAAQPVLALPTPPTGARVATILLVEDDELVRRVTRRQLERAGYRVLAAADGAEALRVVDERSGQLDLVLLDVLMPEMNGPEACRRIREAYPDLPVIFCSGYGDIHELDGEIVGGIPLLTKPFDRRALLDAVRNELAR